MKLRREYKWVVFKALLDPILKYFCAVVLVLILVHGSNDWLAGNDWALYSQDLVGILLIAFFGVFPFLVSATFIEMDTIKGVLAVGIIRLVITVVLVLGTHALTWSTDSGITLGTIIRFFLIYVAFFVYSYFNAISINIEEKKLAEQINQQLDEFHKDENETHEG